MDQALDASAYIFQGFWRNLSKETTRSLTLTLCPTYSVILTNAFALFVAMSGGQLWTIIRFTLHQLRANASPETTSKTHNQQQVVLRNATTDIATARLMLYLAWSCRKNARGAIATCITILVLALFNAAFFMVAGTFSNTLINAGSTVLSRSPFCGVWNETYLDTVGNGNNISSMDTLSLSTEYIGYDAQEVQLNLEYAQTCYSNKNSTYWDSSCGAFEKPRLNWTQTLSSACPFQSRACSHDADVITFDTGHIDSHIDLGINSNVKDRLTYRRVTQCTVLNDTSFATSFTSQNDIDGTDLKYRVAYANYGASLQRGTAFTYSYSNFADFYTNFTGAGTTPFQIGTAYAYGYTSDPDQQGASTFEPIDELSVEDADVGLLFLGFTGTFLQPVDDPWFSAHVPLGGRPSLPAILQTLYTPDRQISTIGCTERHQYCTSSNECTPLAGVGQVTAYFQEKMNLSPIQNVTLDRVSRSVQRSNLLNVVQEIAKTSSPVLAINNSATASFTISLKLPNNQWQLELERWHSIAMARIQRTVVEYASGQIAPQTKYLLPPSTSSEQWLCRNQRIQSTVFQSFNVVALIVILVFGTLIILFSLNIERLAAWFHRRWNVGGHRRAMWNDHDMLGKQRWRALFASPQSSMHIASPVAHMHSPYPPNPSMHITSPAGYGYGPYRSMDMAYLQTNFPPFQAHDPMGLSAKRASSQALSPGDSSRTFPEQSRTPSANRASVSPARSAITADFIFDFGPARNSPSPPCTGYLVEKVADEKPLPQFPADDKTFVIDRGLEASSGADITDEKRVEESDGKEMIEIEPAVGSGPGRWAYYSAHKRRYGPRLAVPAPHVLSTPHVMSSNPGGLRGSFLPGREGNWI
jgi:hypothetical protein